MIHKGGYDGKGVECMRWLWILSFVVLSLLLLQGFSIGNVSAETREAVDLNAKMVYSTGDFIGSISVSGSQVAWSQQMPRGDFDIYGYTDGVGVNVIASSTYDEKEPVVGSTVVWVQWVSSNSSFVTSKMGELGPEASGMPRVDGDEIAFVVYNSNGYSSIYYGKIGSQLEQVSLESTDVMIPNCLDISGNYILVDDYLYARDTGEFKVYYQGASCGRISGEWILYSYRTNFGRGEDVALMNVYTGQTKVIASYDLGYYDSISSMDIDGYYAVWVLDGTIYYYDIITDTLNTVMASGVRDVAIGDGKIAWVSYENGNYEVWYASMPSAQSYVEFNLEDLAEGTEQEYHQLLIIDSQGRKLGGWNPATGDVYKEIPNSVVISGWGKLKAYRIISDDPSQFKIQVIGKHDGKYNLRVRLVYPSTRASGLKAAWVNATGIPIKLGEIDQYTINWDKVIQGAKDSVTIKIDENGDGTFDREVTASSSIDADAKEGLSLELGSTMCLGFLLIIVAVVAIVAFLVKRKKAKT